MPNDNSLSVFALNGLRRHRRGLIAGICKVKAGQPFRHGAETALLSLSTFLSKFHCPHKNYVYTNTALKWMEEVEIVKILLQSSHPLGYITHESIKEATTNFVSNLPSTRRIKIPFRNNCPSKTFCRAFEKRHCYAVYCTKPIDKAGNEAPLITAKELVTNFIDISQMISRDELHPENIWCLTCRTIRVDIGKDSNAFTYLSIISVSNASGEFLSIMHLLHNSDTTEAVQKSDRFESWLEHVASKIRLRQGRGQENTQSFQLMLCDLAIDFINSAVRDWLGFRDIIVYSIPGLSDGFPGNHDVGCSQLWADKFQEFVDMELEMKSPPKSSWTESTLLMFIHLAINAAFSTRSISDSFAEAGIHPLDEVRFYKHLRPLSFTESETICDMEHMCRLLDEAKRKNN